MGRFSFLVSEPVCVRSDYNHAAWHLPGEVQGNHGKGCPILGHLQRHRGTGEVVHVPEVGAQVTLGLHPDETVLIPEDES